MVRATVSIGSFDFPEPTSYKTTVSTLVDSGRNAMGIMVGSVIRELEKAELEYKYISAEDLSSILKEFSEDCGGHFRRDVTFLSTLTNTWVTKEMYISDRSAGIISRNPNTGMIDGYKGLKFSLIEV